MENESGKILEMINNNEIKELKKILQDEIYTSNINGSHGQKKRYAAMKGGDKMLLPQELMAEQLWLLWDKTYGVTPLNKIEELLYRCNLKLKKGKNLEDVRMCVGRGFKSTFGNMELARHKIADEIDKVCVIARWNFAVAKYKSK